MKLIELPENFLFIDVFETVFPKIYKQIILTKVYKEKLWHHCSIEKKLSLGQEH